MPVVTVHSNNGNPSDSAAWRTVSATPSSSCETTEMSGLPAWIRSLSCASMAGLQVSQCGHCTAGCWTHSRRPLRCSAFPGRRPLPSRRLSSTRLRLQFFDFLRRLGLGQVFRNAFAGLAPERVQIRLLGTGHRLVARDPVGGILGSRRVLCGFLRCDDWSLLIWNSVVVYICILYTDREETSQKPR